MMAVARARQQQDGLTNGLLHQGHAPQLTVDSPRRTCNCRSLLEPFEAFVQTTGRAAAPTADGSHLTAEFEQVAGTGSAGGHQGENGAWQSPPGKAGSRLRPTPSKVDRARITKISSTGRRKAGHKRGRRDHPTICRSHWR